MKKLASLLLIIVFVQLGFHSSWAWDYEGHRVVNQLALASLPTNFPAFVLTPTAAERVAFLAGEPDRWRNTPDLPLKHSNGPDHYIDLEALDLYGLNPEMLPVFRYDYVGQLTLARKAHPEKFPPIDPARNEDHTRELVGLLPWAITESYGKLKSGFSYLKAFEEEGGTPEEIANAQQDIVYVMGVMGHYVGDASQPLHTTVHHHGWVGENPHHYTTKSSFHSWIDGGYFAKIGGSNLKEMESKLRHVVISKNREHLRVQTIGLQGFNIDVMIWSVVMFKRQVGRVSPAIWFAGQEGNAFCRGRGAHEGRKIRRQRSERQLVDQSMAFIIPGSRGTKI